MRGKVLITGAGTGIGRETAVELARRGRDVIASTKTEEQAAELKEAAEHAGLKLSVEKLDILDPDDRRHAEEWEVDVLVNNAGVGQSGPIAEIALERVQANFETNVFATLALTQGLVKIMLKKHSGRIVIVGSLAGRVYVPYLGAYCMSKSALEMLAKALRFELKPHGVNVSLVEPGPYSTGFNERMEQTKYEWFDEKSLFASDTDMIKRKERWLISAQSPTSGIVRAVVRAVESRRPKFRYVAPFKYKLLVPLGVLIGK